MKLASKRYPRFVLQLHDRNINFIKSVEKVEEDEIEFFKDGKLHSKRRHPPNADDAKVPFKNAVALIQTLQGSDAFGVDMLPNAIRNGQFDKMAGGLHNPGINICFMNVIIQVLTHSPYLAPAMLRSAHGRVCQNAKRKMVCVACVLEEHIKRALNTCTPTQNPFVHLVQKLIWTQYQLGRQEDAFIFLKHFFEALIKGCYGSKYPYNSPMVIPQNDVMRSFVGRIFGGFLLNVLICEKCNYRSEKLESCFDISVDIYRANKLVDLLSSFVKEETLDSNNKYNCPMCKRHQKATKAMSIYRAPRIMNIVLKRFGMAASGCEKNKKEISFPLSFSMSLHTSKQEQPVWLTYDLYAVVCHLGRSLHMGHYITFIKGQHGFWNRFNDANVTSVSQNTVLAQKQEAYLLFYAAKDDCVQICDMLVNDNAITNIFTTDPVPENRNLESTIVQYRTDLLHADAMAEDHSVDSWSEAPNWDEGNERPELWQMTPTITEDSLPFLNLPATENKSDGNIRTLNKEDGVTTTMPRRCVTRRKHGYRLKLIRLLSHLVTADDMIREIMRIQGGNTRERSSTVDPDNMPEEESSTAPALESRSDNIGTWSDAEQDETYQELSEAIHPALPKRSQEDIEYDRGKTKKKKGPPSQPLGEAQYIKHNSGAEITVHQKSAFDTVLERRQRRHNMERRKNTNVKPQYPRRTSRGNNLS
ncbi:putative ubiquitin carboxyl-terminal hydrolase 16 [Babesia sp. Xinjiang]|uniref:putative ubiquitin carboxyl-terminal hydrolase 16 n=1 Tax=Babesia sp. Xinjiang TaxID=462227 RepID=UPI000A2260A9|nr:putative ubiquitin carboxyl-terminal hydrolase 16 [Babesia sp. Xinjiang]ORM41940.1 putative ubiquitin carboxyl-terminal hydrolase 16 [Babesia sp. Xinjiang]